MGLFDFISNIINVPVDTVNFVGKAIEAIGEATDCEILEDAGRAIQNNSDTISK